MKKALERAIREYEQGIEKEKSSLANFANKYVIKAKSGLMPDDFFISKYPYLKEFLHKHRQIKVKFVLVTLMKEIDYGSTEGEVANFEEAYFHSDTYINIKSTNEEEILDKVLKKINDTISKYQNKGSDFYMHEVIRLEIHTVDYKPMRGGSSYIPLPDRIMRKKGYCEYS